MLFVIMTITQKTLLQYEYQKKKIFWYSYC